MKNLRGGRRNGSKPPVSGLADPGVRITGGAQERRGIAKVRIGYLPRINLVDITGDSVLSWIENCLITILSYSHPAGSLNYGEVDAL
jgi:hypothetical protein